MYPAQQVYYAAPSSPVPPYYASPAQGIPLIPHQRFGFNFNYFKSSLFWIRLLLIPFLIATIVSAALVRNTYFLVRRVNSFDTQIWESTLVFACVGLFFNILAMLMYICNIPNTRLCWYYPWTILFGLLDFAWFVALIVLGAFAATRESHRDYRNESLNEGAFGATSAFALTSAVLFLISALLHWRRRRAPLRKQPLVAPISAPVTTQVAYPVGSTPAAYY